MITITRHLEFDAAHRVMNHESKCATLHGHRYKVEVVATSAALDSIGRVIDFSVIKAKLGNWIDDKWDHTSIFFEDDTQTIQGFNMMPQKKGAFLLNSNPTAENMASYLLNEVCPKMFEGHGISIVEITIWETPNCKATAKL